MSKISPLSGGEIVFATLEGRPSNAQFEQSAILQEFVTATDIRITLVRLNTFGDEIFRGTKVLQSYYYAISDLVVGGKIKCNGHASDHSIVNRRVVWGCAFVIFLKTCLTSKILRIPIEDIQSKDS